MALSALLRLLRRDFQVQILRILADEAHVTSEHGQLSDDLRGCGIGKEHDRFGRTRQLIGDYFDGRSFFHGVAEGDDFSFVRNGAFDPSYRRRRMRGVPFGRLRGGQRTRTGVVRGDQVHVGQIGQQSLGALSIQQSRVFDSAKMLVGLVGEGGGLPAERLIGVELFVASSGGDDAIVFEDGEEAGEVSFGGILDPALVGVGDYYHL